MLKALKELLDTHRGDTTPAPGYERHQLQLAVAVLLYEARRADYVEQEEERAPAELALERILGISGNESAALLEEARAKARHLTSYYAPVAVIKRELSLEERIVLIEHLWRVAFADGKLDYYEDHYVRKIAHLLYVPNTQSMLARNRARAQT